MDIQASKSILAKLLAQENLDVVHAKVPTAFFDTKNRVLTLPIWKDMTGNLYDLLCGHEVGHALYTPAQGWHDAIMEGKRVNLALKGYLNILEDARIEKKIKNRYPGLRSSFYAAYQALFEEDFFGIQKSGKSVHELNFIDRINLHFKLGSFIAIPFSSEEKPYIVRIEKLETWDEVEALARELLDKAIYEAEEEGTQERKKIRIRAGLGEMSDDFEDGAGMDGEELDEADFDMDDPETAAYIEQMKKEMIESYTDQVFRDREVQLLDAASKDYKCVTLPTVNAAPFIVSYKVVMAQMIHRPDQVEVLPNLRQDFRNKNNKYIAYLIKEFELKRNAEQQARARLSKSGEIDTKKVFSYQYNEDIFRRFTALPNGKNHGLIMFFDMSGSMSNQMSGAIEQILVLVEFCRKVNIPFEVYGFTNAEEYGAYSQALQGRQPFVDGEVHIGDNAFALREYFNDKMRPNEYKRQVDNMLIIARAWKSRANRWNRDGTSDHFSTAVPPSEKLNGTPLNPAVVCSIDVFNKFKARTKAEVVNMVYVTDGVSDYGIQYGYCSITYRGATSTPDPDKVNVVVTHKETKKKVRVGDFDARGTEALVKLVGEVTGANIVCFDILMGSGRQAIQQKLIPGQSYYSGNNMTKVDNAVKEFKRDGLLVIKDRGFSEYYVIPGGKSLDTDDEELDVESGANKRDLLRAFRELQEHKANNRVLLGRFVKMIA